MLAEQDEFESVKHCLITVSTVLLNNTLKAMLWNELLSCLALSNQALT